MAQPAPIISPPASTPTSSVVPQPSAAAAAVSATSTVTAQPAKVDLLGDLGGDPFGMKLLFVYQMGKDVAMAFITRTKCMRSVLVIDFFK